MPPATILVVEDNPTTLKMFRVTLEAEGYQVLEAFDGRGALKALDRGAPDMVLQDLVLPDMDGIALARAIRAHRNGADVPVVAMSGFLRLLDKAGQEPGAFDASLVKPIDPGRLVEVVASYVRVPATPEASADRGTILVVDDDPVQLKLLRLRLEAAGYRVVCASAGAEAMRLARLERPRAILCDVLMPDTDGYELCLALRGAPELAGTPVVLASAHYGGRRDEELARSVGASALVVRTPEAREILLALKDATEGTARPGDAPLELSPTQHSERVIEQLKRQARANAVYAERSAFQAAQLSILAGVADALSRSEDIEAAFDDVLAACLDAGGVSCGALYRAGGGDRLELSQARGFGAEAAAGLEDVFGYPAMLEGVSRGAIATPGDRLTEDEARLFLARSGMLSAVLVPLMRERRCVGAMLLGSARPEIGERDLIAFGRAVAAHVAQALALTASFQRLREAADASRRLGSSLDRDETIVSLGALATASLADACRVHLDGGAARDFGRLPSDAEPSAPDSPHVLSLPLVAHERRLGTVVLRRGPGADPFGEADRMAAEDLVGRAALAIDNALLYRAVQDASRVKDEFLATVSHELRTPLNAVLGWSRMLASGDIADESRGKAIASIERNAVAQAQLIEDLLDTAQMVSGKMRLDLRPVRLEAVVAAAVDAVRPASSRKRVELRTRVDDGCPGLVADPDRLQQVVWNLLSNAIKFTPGGGHVDVWVEHDDAHVVLTVTDDGAGIDPVFLPLAFERFKQADGSATRVHGGLGLGLAITRQLVEMHGGTIDAHSDGKGRGCRFRVKLPITTTALGYRPPTPRGGETVSRPLRAGSPADLASLGVLVVDDHEDSRELVVSLLEQCGAEARTASSVAEALACIERQRPDVLLSDLGMPGEDGFTLIRKVRQLPGGDGADVPAVAISGYVRAEDRARALASGYQMYLPKPIDPGELIAVVRSLSRLGSPKSPRDSS